MAALIIQRKLDSLRRCLERIQSRCPETVAELEASLDLQDILVLNINRAVQLCVDIALQVLVQGGQPAPDTMADTFQQLARQRWLDQALADRLVSAVGFRNLAVHDYAKIRWEIVHAIASQHRQDFQAFATIIMTLPDSPA